MSDPSTELIAALVLLTGGVLDPGSIAADLRATGPLAAMMALLWEAPAPDIVATPLFRPDEWWK